MLEWIPLANSLKCIFVPPMTHRFLRASKWKKDVAITRLENTLKWRREFGIYDLVNAKHVEPEVSPF